MICVFLCSHRLSAHSLFLVVAGCLGPCLCAPVLALLVRAHWLAFRLGVCLLGFPAVVCAVTPFPTISSLCNLSEMFQTHNTITHTHIHIHPNRTAVECVAGARPVGARTRQVCRSLQRRGHKVMTCVCIWVPASVSVYLCLPYHRISCTKPS